MAVILKEIDDSVFYRIDTENKATWHKQLHVPMLLVDVIDPSIFENVMLAVDENADDVTIEKAADFYAARYVRLKEKYKDQPIGEGL